MLEQCDFMELTEEVLQQCKGFTCKDEDITEFFTQDYADYAYQLLGKTTLRNLSILRIPG